MNQIDDISTDSLSTTTPETVHTPVEGKPMVFPLTIRNENELLQLQQQLSRKLTALPQSQQEEDADEESRRAQMKRCLSAPDLRK